MPQPVKAYAELEKRFARIAKLGGAVGMLHWDQSVVMSRGGAEARGEQISTLRVLAHELLVAPEMAALLHEAGRGGDALGAWQAANLREMTRRHAHATAVPGDLVEALSRAITRCETVWRDARPASDFPMLLPSFREVLSLTREMAAAKADRLGLGLYDALLDEYDPGRRAEEIDRIFDELAAFLPGLIQAAVERQSSRSAPVPPEGHFPKAVQHALAERLMRTVGFDFERGRLDVSLHPFSGGVPDDSRITTRWDEADFATGLMGVLHETGHALYEQGLPPAWRYQPVGQDRGMTLHESQSLMVEMQICRSRPFISYLAPLLREAFGGSGPEWEAENLYRLSTRVRPGFIRVDADEITYPAHVMLRYRLERAMVAGDLDPADLPGAWNDGFEALLGIRPPDDRRGCLQDIHWPDGAWGYFPTYTLGAITAAQLFEAARRAEPDLQDAIGRGDFGPLVTWLRREIHGCGCLYEGDELIRRATGRPLDVATFRRHLEARYLDPA